MHQAAESSLLASQLSMKPLQKAAAAVQGAHAV
jgi:hypothetical protein